MIVFLVLLALAGLVIGGLARLLVPGPDPMGLFATWLLGLVGSFTGGLLGYVVFGADIDDGAVQASGLVGSVLGAVVVLLAYRAISSRDRTATR